MTTIAGKDEHNSATLEVEEDTVYVKFHRNRVGGGTYVRECSYGVVIPLDEAERRAVVERFAEALGVPLYAPPGDWATVNDLEPEEVPDWSTHEFPVSLTLRVQRRYKELKNADSGFDLLELGEVATRIERKDDLLRGHSPGKLEEIVKRLREVKGV